MENRMPSDSMNDCVPPVDSSSTPCACKVRRISSSPSLWKTDTKALLIFLFSAISICFFRAYNIIFAKVQLLLQISGLRKELFPEKWK